jgi:hypothetical protein
MTARVLFYDIETAPNLGYIWAKWEQNVLAYEREWYLLCVSYQWSDEAEVNVVSLLDFPDLYAADPEDDTGVANALWQLMDEADITIAHNGNQFDNKKAAARFIIHGWVPPSPFRSIDTLTVARQKFKFNSNTLGDLGWTLGLGEKAETGGFGLWAGVMRGDMDSWAKMIAYAKQDTVLLAKVYERLKPWMTNHPNLGMYSNEEHVCPTCGSSTLMKRGTKVTNTTTYQQWQCNTCHAYSRSRTKAVGTPPDVVA